MCALLHTGLLIRRVKTFSLKCESCFRVTHEVHRKFCRTCGHPTLYKITVTTNAEGRIEYHMPRRVRTTNRGARYVASLLHGVVFARTRMVPMHIPASCLMGLRRVCVRILMELLTLTRLVTLCAMSSDTQPLRKRWAV